MRLGLAEGVREKWPVTGGEGQKAAQEGAPGMLGYRDSLASSLRASLGTDTVALRVVREDNPFSPTRGRHVM